MVIRSNGCFACKRRRIKCDQGRPRCQRCATHRIHCPGYPSDTANPVNIVVYGSPASCTGSDSSGSQPRSMPLQMRGAPQKRMQLIASASDWFVPFGGTPKVPLDLMDISRFNGVTIQQPALDAAIHALALVQLGTSSRNPDLLAHAQKEYGRSLRLLSSYIARSSKVWDEETASAIVVLKYCESFNSLHFAQASSIHYIGLLNFLLHRGPVPLKDTTESILFCQARVIIIGGCFAQRRKCFLEDPRWIKVSLTAPGRDRFFELNDIAVRLPGLAELADDTLSNGSEQAREHVLAGFEHIIKELDDFANSSWPTPMETVSDELHQQLPVQLSSNANLGQPYSFADWRSANMYCAWTMIRLLARLESQGLLLRDPKTSWDSSRLEEFETDLENNIENLCRAIPSQIGKDSHSLGVICSLNMLEVASTLLENRGRLAEADWCRGTLEQLRNEGFRWYSLGATFPLAK